MPEAYASSSIADSSANKPGASPGARIHDGVGTSSAASRWAVRPLGVAYIIRLTTAVCSANSTSVEVCWTTSCAQRGQPAVRSAPSRTRWRVGVR